MLLELLWVFFGTRTIQKLGARILQFVQEGEKQEKDLFIFKKKEEALIYVSNSSSHWANIWQETNSQLLSDIVRKDITQFCDI
jgi:hypothetical protein